MCDKRRAARGLVRQRLSSRSCERFFFEGTGDSGEPRSAGQLYGSRASTWSCSRGDEHGAYPYLPTSHYPDFLGIT
jgi:hypothetical protein